MASPPAPPAPVIAYAAVVATAPTRRPLADYSAPGAPIPAALASDTVASLDVAAPGPASYSKAGWLWHVDVRGGLAVVAAAALAAPRAPVAAFVATVHAALAVDPPPADAAPHALDAALAPVLEAAAAVATASRGGAAARARGELEAVRTVMANNIDSVLARGERLTSLVESTDALATRAAAFGRGATALRRAEAWRAAKARAAIGAAVAGVVYLGAAAVCGVGLRHCRG